MGGKKFHQLPHSHLKAEIFTNEQCFFRGNTGHLGKLLGIPLHDHKSSISKTFHNSCRYFGSHALDHPAGKKGQNFPGALRQQPFQKLSLKLLSIAGMGAPSACEHEPLPHRWQGDGSHHCNGLAIPHCEADDRISIFIILKHHRTDGSLEDLHFLVCQFRPLLFWAGQPRPSR